MQVTAVRTFLLAALAFVSVHGASAADKPPLVLEATIPLENTSGRIDHMAVDLKRGHLFVAELGNNTVDVVDIAARRVVARIAGLREPQGVGYSDKADLLIVANAGDGSVRFYRGADMAPAGSVALGDDADNVRIDPKTGNAIVGYGNGGLAMIDLMTRTKIADIRLPAHPEGFQVDDASGRAFVNIPDARQIAVVDIGAERAGPMWRTPEGRSNFPMAFAPTENIVATVFRSPPELALIDASSGAITATLPACDDADDVFFDDRRERIYVSCGIGEIDAWWRDGSQYRPLPPTKTTLGARTSLYVPQLDRLFVARRAGFFGSAASIAVYRPANETTE